MSEELQNQSRPLEEATMAELWQLAAELGISKEGKKADLIARIRAAKNPTDLDLDEEEMSEDEENAPARPIVKKSISAKTSEQLFTEIIQSINMALATKEGLLDIQKIKKNVVLHYGDEDVEAIRDGYSWIINSPEAKRMRAEIRTQLEIAWQSGALNYEMIAKKLRIPDISIRALLDDEFIAANNL